ncbi:hypothetical protein DYGSA30_30210 [Dyella sp. GSA-30]|nr:hypothetical protein DYGSA30_30210 [Dyella sp. GSA-30]
MPILFPKPVRVLSFAFAAIGLFAPARPTWSATLPTSGSPGLKAQLRRNDERLLTAVHRGDRQTWAELTTLDFMYVEEGQVSRREPFLAELEEDGLDALVITNYEVQLLGDTAQVFHEDVVPQRPGVVSTKSARLLMTETWQRVDGKWLLRIVHTDRIRVPPPPVELSSAKLDELAGTYRSQSDTYVIRRHDNRLVGAKAGKSTIDLKVEAADVLFVPDDVYLRKVFQRDAHGRITGFIDRRENTDRLWTRTGP